MTATPSPDDVPPEVEAAYGTAVEDAFIAERGTPFCLGSKDWQLARGWLARGIPAETVIRAVRETFEKRRARGAAEKVCSLSYCANAVEARWEMERRGLAGSHAAAPLPPVDVAERLAGLRTALETWRGTAPPDGLPPETAARAVTKALSALSAIPADAAADEAEEALATAEKSLLAALGRALEAPLAAELDARVAAAAGDLSGLPETARKKVERALRAREKRRLLGLPPLTLFQA